MKTIRYVFKNGVILKVTPGTKDKPVLKSKWSCELNKENGFLLMDEFISMAIPVIYQQVANELMESVTWLDKITMRTRVFKPQTPWTPTTEPH
jgi:hypothetical protein